ISYRELRLLEIDVAKELLAMDSMLLDVDMFFKVNVNQFYGIEIEEFPAQIAQTAMWLVDHQMNMLVSETFGTYYVRIPLTAAASIHNANALTIDWESVVPKNVLSYILGNPPFLGYSVMNKTQKREIETIFEGVKNSGTLDYVTAWYKKAAEYMKGANIEAAFVSTNSICQGEQVPVLWPLLMNKHGVKINFAHQTFKWSNEARGKAAVYCVIVGFSLFDRPVKKLYHYADVTAEPVETVVNTINAYLIDAPMIFIEKRLRPLCKVKPMLKGSSPTDDGNFFLTETERKAIVAKDRSLLKLIRPFAGAYEYIHNIRRYCFWLDGVSPEKYAHIKEIQERLKKIARFRAESVREATEKYSEMPGVFTEIRQPNSDYILIPRHSSETRKYIPIGFMKKNVIAGDSTSIIPNATLYEFGVITSNMHMAWMRYVCGRLELRYRYSGTIVYNNFPWPNSTDKQRAAVEKAAQNVLDARALFHKSSLAVLYDPLTMPPELLKAHQKLDKAVEAAYGRAFDDDSQRVAYLFELYQKLSGELFIETKKRGKGRKK
ncbi:MAG: methylase, partial [Spirochaetaceae bacterium]|nr:methylase [Spirochaetaceae bacterium]